MCLHALCVLQDFLSALQVLTSNKILHQAFARSGNKYSIVKNGQAILEKNLLLSFIYVMLYASPVRTTLLISEEDCGK